MTRSRHSKRRWRKRSRLSSESFHRHIMTTRARQDPPTTDPAERARALALAILDRAPRSSEDLRQRLTAKGVEPEVADALIERYIDVGLLDDTALAATIARTRHAERGLAPRAIAVELRRKGFSADDIEAALEPLTADTQRDTARDLAEARWRRTEGADREARIRRVVGHLARKGYSPSLAFALVQDLVRADREAEQN